MMLIIEGSMPFCICVHEEEQGFIICVTYLIDLDNRLHFFNSQREKNSGVISEPNDRVL